MSEEITRRVVLVGYFLKLFASVTEHSFDLATSVPYCFIPFENLLERLEFGFVKDLATKLRLAD